MTFAGMSALQRKAHSGGIVAGMAALAADRGDPERSVLAALQKQLEAATAQAVLDDRLLQDR